MTYCESLWTSLKLTHIENFVLPWFSFRPLNFQFLQLGFISKNETENRYSRFWCYPVPPLFQEAISWNVTLIFLFHFLSRKYVVSDHIRWSDQDVPVHQNKLRMCLHFDQIPTWHGTDVWNSLSSRSARTSMRSLWKLFHSVKQWLK